MPKFTPPDRPKLTKWQYWLTGAVPILGIAGLTIFVLPGFLTQPQMAKESSEQQQQRLRQQIRSISIRILANGESIGSGVLIDKQDRAYTVITNAHVIQAASAPFQVQTYDGQIYIAALIAPPAKQNRDLSTLRFQSDRLYTPASLAATSPKVGALVWAAGYPLDEGTTTPADSQNVSAKVSGVTIADGKVTKILSVAITGGYQIGSDNAVRKGMSGGALVDAEGNLVGINGIHANPLWDVAETLEDGTKVNAKLQEQIDSYSWAIPIEFVENYSSQ